MKTASSSSRLLLAAVILAGLLPRAQTVQAETTTNSAVGIAGTAGADLIQNTVATNLSAVQQHDFTAPQTAVAAAFGIDGLAGNDQITNSAAVQSEGKTYISIPFVTFTYTGKKGVAESTGIAGGAGEDTLANASSFISKADATAFISEVNMTTALTGSGLPAETEAGAFGMEGGFGLDALYNAGTISAAAGATTAVTHVTLSIADAPLDLFSISDARTSARSVAVGMSERTNFLSVTGKQIIENHGSITARADSDASGTSVTVERYGAARIDDSTTAHSEATGMAGNSTDDDLLHYGAMDADAASTAQMVSGEFKEKGFMIKGLMDLFTDVGKINTTAESWAIGLDGGAGNDTLFNAQTNGIFDVHSRADALSVAVTVSFSVPTGASQARSAVPASVIAVTFPPGIPAGSRTNTPTGDAFTKADTKAWASAAGASGGAGDDRIESRGQQNIFAEAYASSVGVGADISLSPTNKLPIPAMAIAKTATSAQSSARGLDGGDRNDVILNAGRLDTSSHAEADSVSATFVLKGAQKYFAPGVNVGDAKSEGIADTTGIAGGAGNDTITNTAAIAASSSAKANSTTVNVGIEGDKEGLAVGVSLVDASTHASGLAAGIAGGSGNDVIHNAGGISATGVSDSLAVGVGVTITASLKGMAAGVTISDTSSHATNSTAGILDFGGDTVLNSGGILSSAQSTAAATSVGVSVAGGKQGLSVGVSLGDTSATSSADAYGIDLSRETVTNNFAGDRIVNTGAISASARSTNKVGGVTVALAGEMEGVSGGVSATRGNSEAFAEAGAIRSGSGDDHVATGGTNALNSQAIARTSSDVVTATLSGTVKGLALGAALTESTTGGTADSIGIETGAGDDTILNGAAITNSAIADVNSVVVNTTISAAWAGAAFGVSLAKSTTSAFADSIGIHAGSGHDSITNRGAIASSANADSESQTVNANVSVAIKGVSAGLAMARTGTDAAAASSGILAGEGDDSIDNRAALDVDATAKATANLININISTVGAAIIDASTTASATAMGIDGGSGLDTLFNQGLVDVTANSTIDASSTVGNFVGLGSGDISLTNIVAATGIQSAAPGESQTAGETIHNGAGGSVRVSARAATESEGYQVQGGGAEMAKVNAQTTASAIGLAGTAGADTILNDGTNSASAFAEINSENTSIQLFGAQLGTAGVNASSAAAGIHAAQGANAITNGSAGWITSEASVDTSALNMNVGIGASFALLGVTADAVSSGIRAGGDADSIANFGRIDSTASSYGGAGAASIGLFAFNMPVSLASVTVEGIHSGAGDDWIFNSGNINAGYVKSGQTNLVKAESEAVSMDIFSTSLASLGAKANVAGISSMTGNDTIINTGTISVGDTNHCLAWGEAFAFGGQFFGMADAYGGSSSIVTAAGMDGGDGEDLLYNATNGILRLNVMGGAHAYSKAYEFSSILLGALADSLAESAVTASAMQGGAGNDRMGNAGLIHVSAFSTAGAHSDGEIDIGIATTVQAESRAKATATAVGMDLGAGSNYGENTGSIFAAATARARAFAETWAMFDAAEPSVFAEPLANATGILGGNDGNTVYNATNASITAIAASHTSDSAGNASYADGSTGNISVGVAGGASSGASPVTANSAGIATGAGNDLLLNDGRINATSIVTGAIAANADVTWRYPRSDALSYVAPNGKGISAGAGVNSVFNNGRIFVDVTGEANPSAYAYSTFCSATANSYGQANPLAIGLHGDGFLTNSAQGEIHVISRALSYAAAKTSAEADCATANLKATAIGMTPASTAPTASRDVFANYGLLSVKAVSGEKTDGTAAWISDAVTSLTFASDLAESRGTSAVHAIGFQLGARGADVINSGSLVVSGRARAWAAANAHSSEVHPNAVSVASANSLAHGILATGGNNMLLNGGTISVTSYADAYASAYSDENVSFFRDEEAHGSSYAYARAVGIETGNGHDTIINEGGIAVTTLASASYWVETEDDDSEYRSSWRGSSVIGILGGAGNDTIISRGSIHLTNAVGGTLVAIDSGTGNDLVSLQGDSFVGGSILLGAGDDTLDLAGTPGPTGPVDAGAGQDTLAFGGSGSLADSFSLTGFEKALKTGEGTFALPQLATVSSLQVERGALVVGSSYSFGSNSVFEGVLPRDGDCGQFRLSGGAQLAGTLAAERGAGPFNVGVTRFDLIIATNGVSGVFSQTNLPAPRPLLRFEVNYLPDRVQIAAIGSSFTSVADNRVERAISGYLDRVIGESDGEFSGILDHAQQMTVSGLRDVFSSMSPASYDDYTVATHGLARQYNMSMRQRLDTLRLNASVFGGDSRNGILPGGSPLLLAYAGDSGEIGQLAARDQQAAADRFNGVWASGFGQWSEYDAQDGYDGFKLSPSGMSVGFDRVLSDAFTLGISGGYASSGLSLDDDMGGGEIDTFSAGLYGSYLQNRVHIEGALSYMYNEYESHRYLAFDDVARRADSTHYGNGFGAMMSAGYLVEIKKLTLEPFASLQYSYLYENGLEEEGAGSLNLALDERETDALFSELGLRLAFLLRADSFAVVPELRMAWNHDFDISDRTITSSLAGAPNAAFAIPGRQLDQDGMSASAALTFLFGKGVSSSVRYYGDLRGSYVAHMVEGELRWTF
jgi:uncharacterized protein YhjY with autotransporter beta-barrel domain